jgi:hypothetical protein
VRARITAKPKPKAAPKRSKYRNVRCEVNGEKFDSKAEARRWQELKLSRQCLAILERLQAGPATNRELAEIALKYTGRLSELRQAGYGVQVLTHDKRSGLVTYRLEVA